MREVAKLPMMELDCTMVYNYYHAGQRGQAKRLHSSASPKEKQGRLQDAAWTLGLPIALSDETPRLPFSAGQRLGLVNLHGKSDAFAEQEIYASLTAFNFASRVCREVVVRQPKNGVYAYKVNFKMAVMLCKEHLRTPNTDGETLLKEIARYTVPIRPDRQNKRNLKVKGFAGFVYRVAA